jgi:hypothetical protein
MIQAAAGNRCIRGLAPVVVVLALLAAPRPSLAAGLYLDATGAVTFLNSPQNRALTGRLARTEGTDPDATIYLLDVTLPVRDYALVEVDIPFIALEQQDVERGLGDVTLRARARLFARPTRKLFLVSSLRTGSGTTRVYPFASQSIDIEAGLAYVDTLSYFDWWISATGAWVLREPEGIPEDQAHGNFGRFGLGFDVTAVKSMRFGLGATGAVFGEGRTRLVYLAVVRYERSQWLGLSIALQAEGGKEEYRVGDGAVTAGIRVNY